MKRSVWTAVGAMVLAAAVAIPVIAQPPQGGRGPGRGPGPGGPLPMLRGLDRWLVSSGAIYGLCRAGRRNRLIDAAFPRFCFWGVECSPK